MSAPTETTKEAAERLVTGNQWDLQRAQVYATLAVADLLEEQTRLLRHVIQGDRVKVLRMIG